LKIFTLLDLPGAGLPEEMKSDSGDAIATFWDGRR
jgi:hypothetical protein